MADLVKQHTCTRRCAGVGKWSVVSDEHGPRTDDPVLRRPGRPSNAQLRLVIKAEVPRYRPHGAVADADHGTSGVRRADLKVEPGRATKHPSSANERLACSCGRRPLENEVYGRVARPVNGMPINSRQEAVVASLDSVQMGG